MDAIVVIENIARHLERGMSPFQAALRRSSESGFTVLSKGLSLWRSSSQLLMGGVVGRLFREFAVTLAVAIGVLLLISLTTTPMTSAKFLIPDPQRTHGRVYQKTERAYQWILKKYESRLGWVRRIHLLGRLPSL
jgi:multidrug efflux pump subunit AcrB